MDKLSLSSLPPPWLAEVKDIVWHLHGYTGSSIKTVIFWTWLTSISCPWPIRMGELIVTALHTYVLVLVCRCTWCTCLRTWLQILIHMYLIAGMNFPKQVEECGERIVQPALLRSSHYLDFGKVTSSSNHLDQVNVSGTDLNRNFPCSWGAGVGSTTWLQGSSLPFWETYIGRS